MELIWETLNYPIISVNSTESKECHSYTIKEDDEQWEFIEDI